MKKSFILFCLLLITEFLNAQPYYFRRYQVEDGLSNNAVISCMQDKKGFLWFGTKDGLNRFDGYSFKIYRNDPDNKSSLNASFIGSIYEDHLGIMWVGTEHGLYRFNEQDETFTYIKTDTRGDVRAILMDDRQNLWFIAGLTIYRYNIKTNKIKKYPHEKYFEATSICSSGGKLWFSSADGILYKYDAGKNLFDSYPLFNNAKPGTSKWIERIYDTSDGHLFVATSNRGVKYFDTRTHGYEDILTYNQDKTEIYARSFIKNNDDEYWIATETGIFIYNIRTKNVVNLKKQANDPYSLSDNAVYSFLKDREGGIWACTYFGGINYYSKQYAVFNKYFHKVGENSISGNAVREICSDHLDNLWIGTEDGGLNKRSTATGKFTTYLPNGTKQNLSNSNIHGLCADGNELWIGTFEHGLDVMDLRTEKIIRHYSAGPGKHQLKSNFIYSIYKTSQGEILIATTRGLYQYNRKEDHFDLVSAVPDYIFYTSIYQDHEGIIWLGTIRDGLHYYNPKNGIGGSYVYEKNNKNSLSDNRVNKVLETQDQSLWISTESGLCKLDRKDNKFTRFSMKNGLPSNVVYAMLEDAGNQLWVSTSKGLVRLNTRDNKLKIFTKSDGLLGDQFNYNSAYKDASGNMYFGSVKGMISFDPSKITQDDFIPPVFITGFQVNNQELPIGKKGNALRRSILLTKSIILDYDSSSFSIDFAALSYTSPTMTEYAYRMDGIDHEWIYLKANRKIYFTDLKPGNYLFRVKASNSSGVWSNKETMLSVTILPPLWASPLAYFIYSILIVFVVLTLIKRYHKRIERKNMRRMEVFEIEKEKEIYHAKIEFFTNIAHEIRTPLTLIKGPMEKVIKRSEELPDIKKNLMVMNKNTDRLLELTNQLLDFRKTEASGFSLNFVKANVAEIIQDVSIGFHAAAEHNEIDYQIVLPNGPVYAYIDLEAFNKIISNLIDNALKYGLTKVIVELTIHDSPPDFLTIKFKNDGEVIPSELNEKIFEPFFRAKESEIKSGTGIGLSLSRALAELHNGTLHVEECSEGLTIFVLKLPIHQLIEFNLNGKWKKRK